MLVHLSRALCSSCQRHDATPSWAVNTCNDSQAYVYSRPNPCPPSYRAPPQPVCRQPMPLHGPYFFPSMFDCGKPAGSSPNYAGLTSRLHELIDNARSNFAEADRIELNKLQELVDATLDSEVKKLDGELTKTLTKLDENIDETIKNEKGLDNDAVINAFTTLNTAINAEIVALRALDDAAIAAAVKDETAAGLLPTLIGLTGAAQTTIETSLAEYSLKTGESCDSHVNEVKLTINALIIKFNADLTLKIKGLFDDALSLFIKASEETSDDIKAKLDQILAEELKSSQKGSQNCFNPMFPFFQCN